MTEKQDKNCCVFTHKKKGTESSSPGAAAERGPKVMMMMMCIENEVQTASLPLGLGPLKLLDTNWGKDRKHIKFLLHKQNRGLKSSLG